MVLCEGDHDKGWVTYRKDCTQPAVLLPSNHGGLPDPGDEGVGVSSNLTCHSKAGHTWCCVHQAVRQDQKLPCSAASGKHKFVCVKIGYIRVIRWKGHCCRPQTGEIAFWAGLPAGYDKTDGSRLKEFTGIHVHARKEEKMKKCIDSTFRAVRYIDERDNEHLLTPSAATALLYVREYALTELLDEVKCPTCNTIQDDTLQSCRPAGYVQDRQEAVSNIHRRTQCQCCGSTLDRSDGSISNSLKSMSTPHEAELVEKELPELKTDEVHVQLYSSTAALLWTRGGKQVIGVHVHTYNKENGSRIEDDTFKEVTVNGQVIDRNELLANMFRATLDPPDEPSESDHKMELLDD